MLPFSFHGSQQGFEREPAGASSGKSRLRHHRNNEREFCLRQVPFFRKNMTEMHAINGLRNRGNPTQRSGLPRFFSISM
jgi:hypothetical protein